MNTVNQVLTHIKTQVQINELKKDFDKKMQALNVELATALYNDGYDLSVKECSLFLNMREMTVRAYLNPKLNNFTVSYKHGKTFILHQSIKNYCAKKSARENKQ